jgi:hypothetical protein
LNLKVTQPKHDANKIKQLMDTFDVHRYEHTDPVSNDKTQAYVGSHMEQHNHKSILTPDERIARAQAILAK